MSKAYGFIHCHSDHSLKDSPLKIKDMVDNAVQMGAKAITLTDHGTCTGWIEFINACKAAGIKPIPGVEAYVESDYGKRAHLVLLAKNYDGYKEISRAITEANNKIDIVGSRKLPVMDFENLSRNFGNGNVIASSACIQGVLALPLLSDQKTEKRINKIREKQRKYDVLDNEDYQSLKEEIDHIDGHIEQLKAERDKMDALAKKAYKKRIKGLESFSPKNAEEEKQKEEMEKALKAEIEESEAAAVKAAAIRQTLKSEKGKRTRLNKKFSAFTSSKKMYQKYENEIMEEQELLLGNENAYSSMEKELDKYLKLFGDDFYIELQNHGLKDEAFVMNKLAILAKQRGIPVVATNDVHIKSQDQAEALRFMRAMTRGAWDDDAEMDTEYMKSDEELFFAISEIVPEEIAKEAVNNIKTVCDACNVVIPDTPHYPKFKTNDGNEVDDAADLLRRMAYQNIKVRYPDGSFSDYGRLEEELNVIISLGYADYLLIVADFINYAKDYCKKKDPSGLGYGVGPGRGSGAGCLVNYLLGITAIDPLKYGLMFERFLNKDRVSMPDIDTDFSDEVRDAAIQYVRNKYGEESVACIRTCGKQNAKAAIRNSTRILGYEKYPDEKNEKEERTRLAAKGDQICRLVPGTDSTIDEFEDIVYESFNDGDVKKIIHRAKLVEGTATSIGVHAAGVIIGDGTPLKDIIPLMYNTEKEVWATQCDMIEAEEMHLLKMDFLGLNNLDIITECLRKIQKKAEFEIDLDNLPFEPEVFQNIYSTGKTGSVFQFESSGMQSMLREFKPETFEDIILLVAAYRPGPMEFIPEIIKVKQGKKKPHYVVPELKEILETTYGYPIYQEQLISIFHKCAGFSLGEADIIRRYMSKKKVDKFLSYKPKFVAGIIGSGASEKDANDLWESLTGFAKYAFNKSHATAYAMISYQTAWMKYHYPLDYMCAVLNHSKVDKLPILLYECRQLGIEIVPPDVNTSWENFEVTNGAIHYGLSGVKGLDKETSKIVTERLENGRFNGLIDFMIRSKANKGIVEKLINGGAFDCFELGSRTSMVNCLPDISKLTNEIKKKKREMDDLEARIPAIPDKKEKEKAKKRIELLENHIETRMNKLQTMSFSDERSKSEELKIEREVLGAFISDNPLNDYQTLYDEPGVKKVIEQDAEGTFIGIISNLSIKHRKSDGKPMAFFDFEDISGTINANCFTEAYGKYKDLLQEGVVVRVNGRIVKDDFNNEETSKLVIQTVSSCKANRQPIIIALYGMTKEEFKELQATLAPYFNISGSPVLYYSVEHGVSTYLGQMVSRRVLSLKVPKAVFKEMSLYDVKHSIHGRMPTM